MTVVEEIETVMVSSGQGSVVDTAAGRGTTVSVIDMITTSSVVVGTAARDTEDSMP